MDSCKGVWAKRVQGGGGGGQRAGDLGHQADRKTVYFVKDHEDCSGSFTGQSKLVGVLGPVNR